ncbi:hypothetical protein BSLA_02f0534 [Burkholderia stabilis]|nr:hypothetical protein BSLA_02f0534 [Burkholderia stabilis]
MTDRGPCAPHSAAAARSRIEPAAGRDSALRPSARRKDR